MRKRLGGVRPEPPLSKLYAIVDLGVLGPALPRAIEQMAAAGIEWLQLRAKGISGRELYELTTVCMARLAAFPTTRLWLDDRADIAAVVPGVAGVHVGQRDLAPAEVREVVGPDLWIGYSTHDPSQLEAAADDDAVDVVAVGPVFATTGKDAPDPVVGLDFVRRARRLTDKPLVAIGGIDATRVSAVVEAGADVVAVLGAICRGDVVDNSRRLLAAVEDAT